jgi:hypothetical protein
MLLLRRYKKGWTEGKFVLPEGDLCYCLEREWLNNKEDVSCIPEGTYIFKRDRHGRFQWYSCDNVKNRTNIEIHGGNTVDDSLGCLLPCIGLVNGFGRSSKAACNLIKDKFGDSGFVLTIRKWNTHDGKF